MHTRDEQNLADDFLRRMQQGPGLRDYSESIRDKRGAVTLGNRQEEAEALADRLGKFAGQAGGNRARAGQVASNLNTGRYTRSRGATKNRS